MADALFGLTVIDISDPSKFRVLGTADTPMVATGVAAWGDYAYVADKFDGLYVIDVSDPTFPQIVGHVNIVGRTWDVSVIRDIACVTNDSNGLRVMDVSNPAFPQVIGTLPTTNPTRTVTMAGNYAYVAAGLGGMLVVSLANPHAPLLVGQALAGHESKAVAIGGHYAYVAASMAGLVVVDIANPAAPLVLGSVRTPYLAQGVTFSGRYAYVADVLDGVQVIDVSDPGPSDPGRGDREHPGDLHERGGHSPVRAGRGQFSGDPGASEPVLAAVGRPPADEVIAGGAAAWPNPARGGTAIRFTVPAVDGSGTPSDAQISIVDVAGRTVRRLAAGASAPGPREIRWDGEDDSDSLPSGVYFVTITTPGGGEDGEGGAGQIARVGDADCPRPCLPSLFWPAGRSKEHCGARTRLVSLSDPEAGTA